MPWSRSSRRAAVSIEKELQLNEFSSPLRSPGGRQFVVTTGSPMMESLGDRPARLLAPTDEDPRDFLPSPEGGYRAWPRLPCHWLRDHELALTSGLASPGPGHQIRSDAFAGMTLNVERSALCTSRERHRHCVCPIR